MATRGKRGSGGTTGGAFGPSPSSYQEVAKRKMAAKAAKTSAPVATITITFTGTAAEFDAYVHDLVRLVP